MRPYRVLVVTNMWPDEADPSFGIFVREQMESLRPLGVEYDVQFINGRRSRWNYLRAIGEMRAKLRATPYDLIHAHFGLSGLVARFQYRVPLVVTLHGDDVMGQFRRDGSITLMGRFYQASSFLLARMASAVIVQSQRMKSKLRLECARIIPCGVDLDLFKPMDAGEARRALNLPLGKKFVLFPYDRSVERKRFDLVEAATRLAQRDIPNLEILEVVNQPHERLPLYMNASDVFVLASLAEGSPMAVKEAMALNLPVVAVDVGDVPELLGGIEGCFLVPREAGAIAERIVEVCRSGRHGNLRYRMEPLSMEATAQKIVGVYAAVARRK
jgi:teichuronic acid biosynthesis glycosyltransferase TuaC